MGNICRSPTAEGVFRYHAEQAGLAGRLEIDSAGTHAYHVGEPADHRARAAAERRGMSLDGIRARRVSAQDFQRFDYIIAMDPYYGGAAGFERVLDLVEDASRGLLETLSRD
jgi:protein-tyrosine phosphatase